MKTTNARSLVLRALAGASALGLMLAANPGAKAQSVPPGAPTTTDSGGPLAGQTPPGVRPPKSQSLPAEALPGGRTGPPNTPQAIRWTENWSKEPAADASFLDKIRHIDLPDTPSDYYLSLGGEARVYYTDWRHTVIGQRANDSEDPIQTRLRLLGDLHLGPYVRAFLELGDNHEYNAPFVTAPNRDRIDVQQAFVDITVPLGDAGKLTVRPGRFEMPLGNGKLVGVREGLNLRYSYQGVRTTYILPGWLSIDTFAVRPMQFKQGAWDDGPYPNRRFDGVYVSTPKGPFGLGTDVYWYQVDRATATLREGSGSDQRNNWGARIWRRTRTWDIDLEGDYQTGQFKTQDIQAWGVLFEGGYTLADATWQPRLGVRANAFSGDHNLKDNEAGTFVPAFPRLPLLSEAAFFNLSNLVDLYPNVTLKPRNDVTVMIGPDFLWRQSREDGVYVGPAGASLAPFASSLFTGTDYNLEASWQATKRWQLRLFETYFNASGAVKQDGGKTSNYFGLQSDYRF